MSVLSDQAWPRLTPPHQCAQEVDMQMQESKTGQDKTYEDETGTGAASDGTEGLLVAHVSDHGSTMEEYAASDKATARLNQAILSWVDHNVSANEVTEQ